MGNQTVSERPLRQVDKLQASTEPESGFTSLAAPYATVFASSACIMVVELVAGRLISRHLGQSLYTWTTVIGVMLAGISIGNYLGGRLADRRWGRAVTGVQFLLAAAACLLTLALNAGVGAWPALWHLPWPMRIVLHITLVFLLPSAVLGTISPVVARRALNRGLATGRTVGGLFAWSIAGSLVGTFLTGFYLLSHMGVTAVVCWSSYGLIVVGLLHLGGAVLARETGATRAEPELRATEGALRISDWLAPAAVAVVANVAIMAVEIVAGRMLSRSFGQSLYTWTTVIGVVLTGMALGSYWGGRLADRYAIRNVLAGLFLGAAVSCFVMLPLNGVIGYWWSLDDYSWPTQILFYTWEMFLLPSVILGAIGPVATRLAVHQSVAPGRVVGILYACTAVGSIAGTFLTGFVLVAIFAPTTILLGTAGLLTIVGLVYARTAWYGIAWAVAYVVIMLAALAPGSVFTSAGVLIGVRTPTESDIVYSDESHYSRIQVRADKDSPRIRRLNLDHLKHSEVNLDDPRDLRYDYELTYAGVLERLAPSGKPVVSLTVGGGGYTFPRYIVATHPGSHVEVAEIDPAVTEAGYAALELKRDAPIEIHHMDARNRISDLVRAKSEGREVPAYNFIFCDGFNDFTVPYHLTTLEFVTAIEKLLADDGVYMLNVIDIFDTGHFLGPVTATCQKVFPYVYMYNTGRPTEIRDTFVLVCSKRPLTLEGLPEEIAARHKYEGRSFSDQEIAGLVDRSNGVLLTDDYAPVENMLRPVVEQNR